MEACFVIIITIFYYCVYKLAYNTHLQNKMTCFNCSATNSVVYGSRA